MFKKKSCKIAVFHPRQLYSAKNEAKTPSSNNDLQPNNKNNIVIEAKESFSLPPSREKASAHKRLSQRVTSFIGQKFHHRIMDAPTTSFQQTFNNAHDTMMMNTMVVRDSATTTTTRSPATLSSPSSTPLYFHHGYDSRHGSNKTLMRPMSPVSVDFPSSAIIGDTEPLTAAPSYLNQQHQRHHPYHSDHPQHYTEPTNDDAYTQDHSDWLRRSPERRNH